jgi:hypothetical protein
MFQWYEDSVVCFAYLVDVVVSFDAFWSERSFSTSQWFCRGWTLQARLLRYCSDVGFPDSAIGASSAASGHFLRPDVARNRHQEEFGICNLGDYWN